MDTKQNLPLSVLIQKALEQGIAQVKTAGSPLHPFYFDETGSMYLVYNEEGGDPTELVLAAIKSETPTIKRCALVMDTRLTGADGKKWDAILVMACEKDSEQGELWAHRYVPKSLLKKFRTEGQPERVGEATNFIRAALE